MQNAAILWHVSEVDRNPVALGAVGLVRVLPLIGLSVISGVVADRYDRRKVMFFSQIGMGLCAALLGLIAFWHVQSVWPIYLLAAVSSAFGAFDLPARQALIPAIVPRDDLPNAYSVNATMWHAASILGPAISGFVIAVFGTHWAYWFNALSFLAVLAALALMRVNAKVAAEDRPPINLAAVVEGLRFVRQSPIVFSTMIMDFLANFFAAASVLLPLYAKEILHVGAQGYGFLAAAEATGAFLMGLTLTFIHRIPRQGRTIVIAVICYSLSTILFGLSTNFWMAFIALAAFGASDTVSMVIRNTIRQLYTPDHIRGRMVAFNMIFFVGGPHLGELEAGLVASLFGLQFSVISGGVACLVAVAWVARHWLVLWQYDTPPAVQSAAAD